ncbi:MAG: Wzz/FepE/Etk N-terminal domain-containing protein [Rhodobacter sp.]|nr:Wzz/FepE/Etk N-terminal domain-containing protein [Rhodobacter sp.]
METDLRVLLSVLWRSRRMIALTTLIVFLLAFVMGITTTPIYRATTLLLVDARGSNLLSNLEGSGEQGVVLNSRIDSEVEILRSSATRLAVVQAAQLVQDPLFRPSIGWFERFSILIGQPELGNNIRALLGLRAAPAPSGQDLVKLILTDLGQRVDIRRRGLSYLIEISVELPDPARAAELANIFAQTYLHRQIEAKIRVTLEASDVLGRQIETARAALSAADSATNVYIEQNLARIASESGDPAAVRLRTQIESLRAEINGSRVAVSAAEIALDTGEYSLLAETLGDAAIDELNRQRVALANRLGQLPESTAEAINLAQQLSSLEESLRQTSAQRLDAMRTAASDLEQREASARESLRETLLSSDISSELLTDLFELQQNATNARNQLQTLLARSQEFGTRSNLQVADARVVSEALAPVSAQSPNLQLILLLALIGGLFLGTAIALTVEFYVGGITSQWQLENVTQWRVPVSLRRVPLDGTESAADLISTAPMSAYAEAFRKLRAAFDRNNTARPSDGAGTIILVTSALMAEGKTTAAIALARTYAIAGKRTLLIDCDLRKPAVGSRIGIEASLPVSEFLAGSKSDKELILSAAVDPKSGLLVATTRRLANVPTDDLINSAAFRQMLADASALFDVVVIDSAPLLPLVDTTYIINHVDCVLLVVRYSTTTQGEVREAVKLISEIMTPETRCLAILSHDERQTLRSYAYGRESYYGEA